MAETMKTLIVEKDGSLRRAEVPLPAYTEKQALVRTVACGICNGTDAKLIHRKFKGFEPEQYPVMLGHEGVGEVIAVGRDVVSYNIGDKVLLPFVGDDPVRYPGLTSAWGAFSEYGVVDDLKAYPEGEAPECAYAQTVLPEWVDPVDGVMIVTLREVLSAIHRFGISRGDRVAVFGCGPVGLTFIHFMKLLGVGCVIAFDVRKEKLASALTQGADAAFDSTTCRAQDEVRKLCPGGVDYVLDAVGFLPIINQAMTMVRDNGKICCYGISPDMAMQLEWKDAPYNWQLHFQQFPSKKEEGAVTDQILSWMQSGDVVLKDYISDYFPAEEMEAAFQKLEQREISKKGIVAFGKQK